MWLFVSVCVATTSFYLSDYAGNYCRWCRRWLQLLLPNFSAHVSLLRKRRWTNFNFPVCFLWHLQRCEKTLIIGYFHFCICSIFKRAKRCSTIANSNADNFFLPPVAFSKAWKDIGQFYLFLLQMGSATLLHKKNFTNAHFDLWRHNRTDQSLLKVDNYSP